jgi:2-dehydro-3-deoxyphosphogluconate aldolase / (4S)-4-hydroxy-2-oxoglutarate aldolase
MKLHESIQSSGVVAVIRHADALSIISVVEALKKGGITAIEITVENKGGFQAIEVCSSLTDIALGAGTVLTLEQAKQSIQAGAKFIVSPILNEAVVRYCIDQGIDVIPGVFTPTEIYHAIQAGAKTVKIFPAAQLSPAYLKNIKAPLPPVSFMVTGGIDAKNAGDYIAAGASAVGIGSQLVDMKQKDQVNFLENITARAIEFVALVKQNR